MPTRCIVPGCTSNSQPIQTETCTITTNYRSMFRFPKNEELRQKWISAVSRKNWSPSRYSAVCILHFTNNDVVLYDKWLQPDGTVQNLLLGHPKLKKNAVPSIFPESVCQKQDVLETQITDAANINLQVSDISQNDSRDINVEDKFQSSSVQEVSDNLSSDDNDTDVKVGDEFTCKVCKQMFLDEFDLQLHFKSRRLKAQCYKCCGCDRVCKDNTRLNVHARKHTGEKPYACKVCRKRFSLKGNLTKHMCIHTGERRYECTTCSRKFIELTHLQDHIRTHSSDRPFACDYCNTGFKTKAKLRKHINIHLKPPGDMNKFKCHLCPKFFCHGSHLRNHINSHIGVRLYRCELCMRTFPSPYNLRRHLVTHTSKRPFTCQECGKGFLTLENMNRHKRSHTGEKPFGCDICGKFFGYSATLKEHRRIHTGHKPFGCSICNKHFYVNRGLYRHIRQVHPAYAPKFKMNDPPPDMKKSSEEMKLELEEIEIKDVLNQCSSVETNIERCNSIDGTSEMGKCENSDSEVLEEIHLVKVEKQEFDFN